MKRVLAFLFTLLLVLDLSARAVPAASTAPVDSSPLLYLQSGPVDLRGQTPTTPLPARATGMTLPVSAYVVQFKDVITEAQRDWLRASGAQIDSYMPDDAYLVRMNAGQAVAIAKSPDVLAVAHYSPDWKTGPDLPGAGRILVQVHLFAGEEEPVARLIRQLGGAVKDSTPGLIAADLDASAVRSLARSESVIYIDPVKAVHLMNDVASGVITASTPGGPWAHSLTGEHQIIAIADTGLDTGDLSSLHPDLRGQLWDTPIALGRPGDWSDPNGHGTHVAGSAVGAGTSSGGQFKGVAPGAKLVFQSIMDSNGGMGGLPMDLSTLFGQAAAYGATIHSDSWGTPVSGGGAVYDSRTRQVDDYIWNNRNFSILFAAGDDGQTGNGLNSINAPGTAKNAITVGASYNNRQNFGVANPNQVWPKSSHGWTPDGRVKPDIVAPGTYILSTRSSLAPSSNFVAEYSNSAYAYMSGTSMATPLTAGAAALVREFYVNHLVTPSAALIKATLINGARDMGYGWMNRLQGWGRVDLTNSLYPTDDRVNWYENEAVPLSTGQFQGYDFVAGVNQMLKFTLVWSDYPGAVQAAKELVNDLDLEVTAPDGKVYKGNCFASNTASANCTSFDRVNNVENVYFSLPQAGTYHVKVRGNNVPMGPQTYALVVSGDSITGGQTAAGAAPVPTITAPSAGAIVGGTVLVAASTTDDSSVAKVEFYEDGGLRSTRAAAPWTWSWNTVGNANATHTLVAKAYDRAGNVRASAPVTVTVDNATPAVAINSPGDGASVSGAVTVSATVTGISGVSHADLYVDGAYAGTSNTVPFSWPWDTTAATAGSHSLLVKAYDLGGSATNSAPISVTVDNVAPTVSITAPANAASVSGPVTVTASAGDNRAVTKVEFYLDGALQGSSTTSPYSWTWDSSTALSGNHLLAAKAYDAAGNVTTSSPVTVSVNLPPTVDLTNPLYANTVLHGTVPVSASAWDADGVAKVEFYLDGTLQATANDNPYTWAWDTTGLADGSSHVLEARAYDTTGAVGLSPSLTVKVDNQAPTISITAPLSGASVAGVTTVTTTVADNLSVAKVEFYLDGVLQAFDNASPFTWVWDTGGAASGSHSLQAKAYDVAGNMTGSATVTVNVDAPPTIGITSPSAGTAIRGTVTVTTAAADTEGLAKVEFYLDGALRATDQTGPYTWAWDTTGSSRGTHTLTARAYDSVGNITASLPVSVNVDNLGPAVAILSPKPTSTVHGTVAVQLSTPDAIDMSRVEYYLDGTLASTNQFAPYTWNWDTTGIGNATHTLRVTAYDSIGNATTTSPMTVTVDNAPPTVIITNPTTGTTVSNVRTITATATDNLTTFPRVEFYLDGVMLGSRSAPPYTWDWNTARSTNGPHILTAKGYDAVGNVGTSVAVPVTVDLPPTVRIMNQTGVAVRGSVTVNATATDANGVQRVEFFVDGQLQGTAASYPYSWVWDTTGTAAGNHEVTARAFDTRGNYTVSAPVTMTIDNQPPTIAISAPVSGAVVAGTTPVTAAVTDNGAVARVDFYLDGELVYTRGAAPFTYNWNTGTTTIGSHTLQVKGYDALGNVAASTPVNVTVDIPPALAITSPTAAQAVYGVVPVTATATHAVDVTRLEFYLDGALTSTVQAPPYVWNWDTTAAAPGTHMLSAMAYDPSGHTTSADMKVIVDNQGPSLNVWSPAPGSVIGGRAAVLTNASDQRGVDRLEFYVDGTLRSTASNAPYNWQWNTATYPDGAHDLVVKAYDSLGNMTTSQTIQLTVDNQPPTVSITAPAANETVHGTYTATISWTDNQHQLGRVEYWLDSTLQSTTRESPFSWTFNSGMFPDGSHVLKAKAFDTVGNMSESAPVNISIDTPPALVLLPFGSDGMVRGQVPITTRASDARGVSSVEFYVDGVRMFTDPTAPFAWTWDTTGLPNGSTHTVSAKAYDASNNVTTVPGIAAVVDNQPPVVALTEPQQNDVLSNSILVQAGATDNSRVAKVEFYLDGTPLGLDASDPYQYRWDTTTATNGLHNLTARAYDTAGNTTNSAVTQVYVDLPPTISITSPTRGAGVKGTLTVTTDAQDAVGLTKVEFYVDGFLQSTVTTAPWNWAWNTVRLVQGGHVLTAKAYDTRNNVTVSAPVAVFVDNQGPVVTVSNPPNNASVRGTITAVAGVVGFQAINKVDWYLDGNLAHTDETAPFNWLWNTATAADGVHTLSARATDVLGNANMSAVDNITVDNTPPTVALTAPTAGDTLTGVKTVTADASDNRTVQRVEFYLDGSMKSTTNTAPYTWTFNTATVSSDGPHVLTAKAYDTVGNVTESAPVSVSIDLPPWVRIYLPRPNLKGVTTVTAQATDVRGLTKVEFYLDGVLKSTSPGPTYTWDWDTTTVPSASSHVLTAKAYDTSTTNVTTSVPFNVVVDNQAPTVAITAPTVADPPLTGVESVTVSYGDDRSVTLVQYYVDGALKYASSTAPFTWKWDTTTATNGSHTLTARAFDAVGNYTTSAPVAVTVDLPPKVSVTAPVGGTVLKGTATVTANATDLVGVTSVDFYVDGHLQTTVAAAPYTWSWDTTSVSSAGHTIYAKAHDAAGNATTSSLVTVFVDNQAPTANITFPFGGSTVSNTVTVAATASDNRYVTKVEFYLDGQLVATDTMGPYQWSWNTATATHGSHTLMVKAYDAMGNIGNSSTLTVTVN